MRLRRCLRRRGREVLGVFLVLLWECPAEIFSLLKVAERIYKRHVG